MKTPDDVNNKKKSIEQHLMERELVDFDIMTLMAMNGDEPQGASEITLNEEVLDRVADAWNNNKGAITAVISARIKPLIMQVALRDIPQEVTVTRQAIIELVGVIRDFETLHAEATKRSKNKEETPAESG